MKRIFLILWVMLMVSVVSYAAGEISGVKMIFKEHMDALMGQPVIDTDYIFYGSDKGVRMEIVGKFDILFHSNDSRLFFVYPGRKEFSKIEMAQIKPILEQQKAQVGEVIVSQEVTGKKGKVYKWNTYEKNFKVKTNFFEMEIAVEFTTDLQNIEPFKKFWEDSSKFEGEMGKFTRAVIKSEGFPVKLTGKFTVRGESAGYNFETQSIEKATFSTDLFVIPKDYKEVPMNIADFHIAF